MKRVAPSRFPSPRARRAGAARSNERVRGKDGAQQSRAPDEGRTQTAPNTRLLRDRPLPVKDGQRERHSAHEERGAANTLSNPVEHGFMITCWQQGRRMLMHSSEVAKMMKGARRAGAVRADPVEQGESREPDNGQSQAVRATRSRAVALDPSLPTEKAEREAVAKPAYDLSPPPFRPRSRRLAENETWQLLAKEMVRLAGHPPRCHKAACRRAKKCAGGSDACYLREFDTVDVVMQRDVLPAIKRAGSAAP